MPGILPSPGALSHSHIANCWRHSGNPGIYKALKALREAQKWRLKTIELREMHPEEEASLDAVMTAA